MNSIFIVLPILTILMFNLGLTLQGKDFLLVIKRPKAVFAGMFGQLLVLPLLAWCIAMTMGLSPIFTIGLVLIACCPGGSSSNVFSMLAKGDVALSVSLTAISSIVTLLTVPAIMQWTTASVGESIGVTLPVGNLLMQNLMTMLLPILLGIGVRHFWSNAATKIEGVLSRLAFPALMLLAGTFFVQHHDTISDNIGALGLSVTMLLLCAIAVAALLCVVFKLQTSERRTIVIEVGMQNAAQAIAIASSPFVFGDGRFAIPAILYALMMNIILLIYVGNIRYVQKFLGKGAALMIALLAISRVAMAQSDAMHKEDYQMTGKLELSGGIGAASPYGGDLNLKIHDINDKFMFNPFFGLKDIGNISSEKAEDIDYVISRTGNVFSSQVHSWGTGLEMIYGFNGYLKLGRNNLFASVKRETHEMELHGNALQGVLSTAGNRLARVRSNFYTPTYNNGNIDANVNFKHVTDWRYGEWFALSYDFNRVTSETESVWNVLEDFGFGDYATSFLVLNTETNHHKVGAEWFRTVSPGHSIKAGARYDDKLMKSNDMQQLDDKVTTDESFQHREQMGAAYAEYTLGLKDITASAKLEYEYTHMGTLNLHDIVSNARLEWDVNSSNSLSLSYRRWIVRPALRLLNPARIRGTFTLDYGCPELEGTHVNNLQLMHVLKNKNVRLTTTLAHIFANDGIIEKWMVNAQNPNIRETTFGNEGVRRAWSLTPDAEWNVCSGTTLGAKVNVIWDKRIAYAINMAKEHWGVTTQLRLQQMLPYGIRLGVTADYSEGNTIDLYSHYGRMLGASANLARDFGKHFSAAIDYRYTDYPDIVVTQGAYTGAKFNRPVQRNAASLTLKYKF